MSAMTASGIRRNFKNIVHNYSDAQVKVREATSNDPWGPSSTIMSEIADLTYNVVAFSEIMQMIWKRLNDHGRNWRHVYKALVLLEYLIKTGTEKVAQQCKENIFAIQTLKDFQYIEDNKDQGINVREKAKQLVSLLKDDERLKNERARALKAKERFAQATSGIGNEAGVSSVEPGFGSGNFRSDSFSSGVDGASSPQADLESARPQTAGEEELQLQLALAMSKEEADQEELKRRSDDVRLQMAITQSQEDFKIVQDPAPQASALLDLLDVGVGSIGQTTSNNDVRSPSSVTDPWGMPLQQNNSWNPSLGNRAESVSPTSSDPWTPMPAGNSRSTTPTVIKASRSGQPLTSSNSGTAVDPWNSVPPKPSTPAAADPWGAPLNGASSNGANAATAFGSTPALAANGDTDGFDLLSSRAAPSKSTNNLDRVGGQSSSPFDMSGLQQTLPPPIANQHPSKKTPESFLGENSALVNLDALVSSKPPDNTPGSTNPFALVAPPPTAVAAAAAVAPTAPNPFQMQQQQQRISINQLRSQQQFAPATMGYPPVNLQSTTLPPPMVPTGQGPPTMGGPPVANNPFL